MERTFQRSFNQLQDVFDFTNEFAIAHAINDKVRYVLDLAVEEFFTNMVKYNPRGRSELLVRMVLEQREVIVHLVDPDSESFDVTKERSVDLQKSLEERKPGGLGVFLVQKLVDNLHYSHHNRVSTISFRLPLE
ncbi:MAG: ATP-binding protein [Bacteroidota bacterium]